MAKSDNKSTAASASNKKEEEAKPSAVKSKASPTKSKPKPTHHTVSGSLDVILPTSLGNATGECTVLVQIDPNDSKNLDFEGTTGAIGRFQVDNQGIILDLKGSQYQGSILQGPTAMIASLHHSADHTQELRLEAITDEFCPLVKTQDIMAKLDGQVEGTFDESYQLQEEDVNISAKRLEQQQEQAKKQLAKGKNKTTTSTTTKAKRKAPASSSKSKSNAGSSKKTKVSMGRKK